MGIFQGFVNAIDNEEDDLAYTRYLRFQEMAKDLAVEADTAMGYPKAANQEATKVVLWMKNKLRMVESPGVCEDKTSAEYHLRKLLDWN